jgi:ATP-binding cassette subfamily F protein 3
VKKIETRVATLDKEITAIEAKLADPSTYHAATSELLKLSQQQGEFRREKDELESEWLELLDQIEG